MRSTLIMMRSGALQAVLLGAMIGFFSNNELKAHPELFVETIDKTKDKTDPNTGVPLFELKPVFLSPTSNVHETLIAASITLSNIQKRPFSDKFDVNYIKGVYWNDSPERSLCPWCSRIEAYHGALKWSLRFREAQRLVADGKLFTHGDPVFERSHYGDLAFIHGMATRDGVSARETRRKLLIWAEFAYKAATGKISAQTKVKDVKVQSFDEVFNHRDDVYDKTLINLFGDPDVRRSAIGSLLHLIQDSYSPAHIERENHDQAEGRFCRGTVVRFLSYPNQDVGKHSEADKWPDNLPRTLKSDDRICDPISAGARILALYAANDFSGASWDEVRVFLETVVYPLKNPSAPSGPGEDFMP